MRFPLLSLFVILMPILEIAGFIIVGKAIGLWPTLALVILGAFLGLMILRGIGLGMFRKLSASRQSGTAPAEDIVHGVMLGLAGILLFLPGFITDIIGLLLLLPFVRKAIWARFSANIIVANNFSQSRNWGGNNRQPSSPDIVDLDDNDFHRQDPNGNSPWRKGPDIDHQDGPGSNGPRG